MLDIRQIVALAAMPLWASAARAFELAVDDNSGVTPPRMLESSSERIGKCYARSARRSGKVGRVLVHATIGPDGKVSQFKLSPGVESWQEETAKCVVELLRFEPATKDGTPVSAETTIPLKLSLLGSNELTMPELASTESEIEDAYRACYPPDELAIAEPRYRVTLSKQGKATRIELVESVGLDSLDQAGICMLKRLSFRAARRGNEPVQSTAIMPILLRPPR